MKYIRTRHQDDAVVGFHSWSAFHEIAQEHPKGVFLTKCGVMIFAETVEQRRDVQVVFQPGLAAWHCKPCILARAAAA